MEHCQKKGLTCLKTGHINQDPIENFFGCIRSHGIRNIKPTCYQTEGSFKALLVSNLTSTHSIGANCKDDEGTLLTSLSDLIESENANTEANSNRASEFDEPRHAEKSSNEIWSPLRVAIRVKSAGELAKSILSSTKNLINCTHCKNVFFCNDPGNNEYVNTLNSNSNSNSGVSHEE